MKETPLTVIARASGDAALCMSSAEAVLQHLGQRAHQMLLLCKAEQQEAYSAWAEQQAVPVTCLPCADTEEHLSTLAKAVAGLSDAVLWMNLPVETGEEWLEKLEACAEYRGMVGTVTPVTNHMVQVPAFFELSDFHRLVSTCCKHRLPARPPEPTACLYIPAGVAADVPLVCETDTSLAHALHRFCLAATEAGYAHYLCDDTYMLFGEEAKSTLQMSPMQHKLLKDAFPKGQLCLEYDYSGMQRVLQNINIHSAAEPGKPSLLYVLHADFRDDSESFVGGTQFHVKDLVANLRRKYNIYVLARDAQWLRLTLYTGDKRISFSRSIGAKTPYFQYYNEKIARFIGEIMDAYRIDLVHVHHLEGLSLDIFQQAKDRHIPLLMTLHDFYTLCPCINLMNADHECCIGRENPAMCDACMHMRLGIRNSSQYLPRWRKMLRKALMMCETVVTPSGFVRDTVLQFYPELKGKLQVVEHGMDLNYLPLLEMNKALRGKERVEAAFQKIPSAQQPKFSGWAYVENRKSNRSNFFATITDSEGKKMTLPVCLMPQDAIGLRNEQYRRCAFESSVPFHLFANGMVKISFYMENEGEYFPLNQKFTVNNTAHKPQSRLNIGLLGNIGKIKGSRLASWLSAHTPADVSWYVLGAVAVEEKRYLPDDKVFETGWYDRKNLKSLVETFQLDAICILSIAPETFCYTLSEAWSMGIPVIAVDQGAVGQRMGDNGCKWLYPVAEEQTGMLELLSKLTRDSEEYQQEKQLAEKIHSRSIAEMCDDYQALYNRFPTNEEGDKIKINNLIYDWIPETTVLARNFMNKRNVEILASRLNEREEELRIIKATKGYRVLEKARQIYLRLRRLR